MITATALTRAFDRTFALRDVTLTIESGEMFALVGPHGAGKTTFFRIVGGGLRPTSGRLTTSHRRLGVVPQRFSLDLDLSVDENLAARAKLHDIDLAAANARGSELLARVGLGAFRQSAVRSLSRGMRQKLALAAALLTRPDLLLLDEPTTGMDAMSRYEFWQALHELHCDGLTVVVALPHMDEAMYATRHGVLHDGRLIDPMPGDACVRRRECADGACA